MPPKGHRGAVGALAMKRLPDSFAARHAIRAFHGPRLNPCKSLQRGRKMPMVHGTQPPHKPARIPASPEELGIGAMQVFRHLPFTLVGSPALWMLMVAFALLATGCASTARVERTLVEVHGVIRDREGVGD